MWAWSEAAAAELAGGHTPVSRVDVLHSGKPVYQLEVVSGSVNVEAARAVRSNLACTLVDPTGALSRGDVGDLLDPYLCEIAPHRGVRVSTTRTAVTLTPTAGFGAQPYGASGFGGGALDTVTVVRSHRDELAPLGVFGLTSRNVRDSPEGLVISLSGQDRAMGYQGPMDSALTVNAGTPVEAAIARLLATRNPGLSLLSLSTGFTCGPLLFPPDVDVWAEAQKLAESVGARLFHDRNGQCVLALAGPASDRPVSSYVEGDGRLLSVDRAEDSDTIRNVVVAETPDGRIRAVAQDNDPGSPTYVGGRYGRRVHALVNQHFGSVTQALVAANARLAYELGRSETVSFTAIPDPGMDVDEVTTVHRPRAGLEYRGLVVAAVDMPLGVTDSMRVDCRRSRLAQDGRVLEMGELAA